MKKIRFLCIILILLVGKANGQTLPYVVVNNSNEIENVHIAPDSKSKIVTKVSPEIRFVAIDSIEGWYKIDLPVDYINSPNNGWVKSDFSKFTPDFSNDYIRLNGDRVVLRSKPTTKIKPFSVLWIDINEDRNYASTKFGQYFAVKSTIEDTLGKWYQIYVPDNHLVFKNDKLEKTRYGLIQGKYATYFDSYEDVLNNNTIAELEIKYNQEKQEKELRENEVKMKQNQNIILLLSLVFIFGILVFVSFYFYRFKKSTRFKNGFNSYLIKKYSLTTQNLEFWEKLVEGYNEKIIAEKLNLSIEAIKSRRKSLYKKIKVIEGGSMDKLKAVLIYNKELDTYNKITS